MQDLKALAKAQMSGVERVGKGTAIRSLQRLLGPHETVDQLFGARLNGQQAVLALTNKRLLVAYGLLGKSDSVEYTAISQINTGLTKVEITGAGVRLTAKSLNRKDAFVRALNDRRASGQPTAPTSRADGAIDDPTALISKLAELRDSGAISDDEYTAKKAQLLERI